MRWQRVLGAVAMLVAPPSPAEILTVHPDGTAEYATIQAAIEASAHGDVIELVPGTYRGPGNRDVSYLGRGIAVRGQGGKPEECIIDCEGSVEEHHRGFLIDASEGEASLEAVTITNGYAIQGGAVVMYGSPVLRNCVLIGNTAERDGGGLFLYQGSVVFNGAGIDHCTIVGNQADRGGGIAVVEAHSGVEFCLIADNYARIGGGCFFEGSSSIIQSSTVAGNFAEEEAGGIWGGVWGSEFLFKFSHGVLWNNCAGERANEAHFQDSAALGYPHFRCSVVDVDEVVASTASYSDLIVEDPQFCAPRTPCVSPNGVRGDYSVATTSRCLPGNNQCSWLRPIGALGEGCAATPVETSSWARIKNRYRP